MTPPIWFINLDARQDRRAFMEGQFAALGLAARRMPAVEASALPVREHKLYGDSSSARFLPPGPLACSLSHLAVWRELVASGAEWGVVFEDDVLISRDLPSFLAQVSMAEWDLLRIEAVGRRARLLPPSDMTRDGRRLRRFRSALIGSAGYLLRASAAAELLRREAEVLALPMDFALTSQMHEPARSLCVGLVDPAYCIQLQHAGASPAAHGDIQHGGADRMNAPTGWRAFEAMRANIADNLFWYVRGARRGRVLFDGRPVETASEP